MEKLIEKTKKVVEAGKKYAAIWEQQKTDIYEELGSMSDPIRNMIPSDWEVNRRFLDPAQRRLDIYNIVKNKGIDITQNFWLTDPEDEGVFLSFNADEFSITPFIYIENGGWIYNHYIGSWSGMNEWIKDEVVALYDLYSGNSGFNHAFGTVGLDQIFNRIEDKSMQYKDAIDIKGQEDAQTIANGIEILIKYWTDPNNEVMITIKSEIERKFKIMKGMIEDGN